MNKLAKQDTVIKSLDSWTPEH